MEFTFDQSVASSGSVQDSVLDAAGQLLKSIRSQLQRQIDNLPPKQVVLDAAAAAYDRYIAPLDIPGVPAMIEPWVDNMLRGIFLRLVSGVYDQLQAL